MGAAISVCKPFSAHTIEVVASRHERARVNVTDPEEKSQRKLKAYKAFLK